MYREIVVLLIPPRYFFCRRGRRRSLVKPPFASFVGYFPGETRAIRVAMAASTLTNELAIVAV